jgi:hypothetical protein
VLIAFVEAVIDGDADPTSARRALRHALGDAALVDAAATVASFNAVVKVADGTGIPLEPWKAERTADIRAALAIDDLRSHDT